jgi:hypothetical protein
MEPVRSAFLRSLRGSGPGWHHRQRPKTADNGASRPLGFGVGRAWHPVINLWMLVSAKEDHPTPNRVAGRLIDSRFGAVSH